MLLMHPGSLRPLTMESSDSFSYDQCLESLYKPLGMHFCVNMKLPKPFYNTSLPMYPMNGPRSFKVFVKKADQSMQGYEFSGQFEKPDVSSSSAFHLPYRTFSVEAPRFLESPGLGSLRPCSRKKEKIW